MKAAREREREREREEEQRGRGVEQRQDGRTDEDNEADRSQPRLRPIRIKLAGPWQRLGRTVGHEERGKSDGGGAKGENIPVIKTK